MDVRSLQTLIQKGLEDAAKAHHNYVEALALSYGTHETDVVRKENEKWEPFYAEWLTRLLTPVLTCIQASVPEAQARVSTVRNAWDGGPSYQAADAVNYSKTHVG